MRRTDGQAYQLQDAAPGHSGGLPTILEEPVSRHVSDPVACSQHKLSSRDMPCSALLACDSTPSSMQGDSTGILIAVASCTCCSVCVLYETILS